MKSIYKLLFIAMLLTAGAVQGIKAQGDIDYLERSWDEATQTVKTEIKTKHAGEYTVINGSYTGDSNWIGLYDDRWYVVTGNSNAETLNVLGNDTHLVLCDGATLTLTGGVKLRSGYKLTIYSQGGDTGQLIVTNRYSNGSGIGSGGISDGDAGLLIVHGGIINATGNGNGAGIGGSSQSGFGQDPAKGGLIVYGGSVTGKGDSSDTYRRPGAGIGSGYQCKNVAGYVTIYGGEVHATGGGKSDVSLSHGAAGIGGGDGAAGAIVHIYGGNVTAQGTSEGAGIGGGRHRAGVLTHIHGGQVTAVADAGAGIGGGSYAADGGKIIIDGGEVWANSGRAGIGCGSHGEHADIAINGGKVFAYGPVAIGVYAGDGVEGASCTLSLYDQAMVRSGANPTNAALVSAADRTTACTSNSFAYIEPCTHDNAAYTVSGITSTDTHTKHCNYCVTAFTPETHTFSEGKCTVCGVEQQTYTVTVNVPADNGTTDGVYETVTYKMVPNTTFKLPASPVTFSDRVFAGWLLGTAQNNSYTAREGDDLHAAGEEYTITGDVTFTARYSYVYIQLADNADNSETLYKYIGKNARIVRLAGRTLYKDGSWNTLCLPFDVTTASGTLSGDNVQAMTLDTETSTLTDGTLTLNFTTAEAIPAGTPFIIKWDNTGNNIVTPEFGRVTIDAAKHDAAIEGVLTFTGTYAPVSIGGEDKTVLFLGSNNELYYPNSAMSIGSCRAYFQLDGQTEGELAAGVKAIRLNFDDSAATAIEAVNAGEQTTVDGAIYNLSGQRVSQPTKGIYIINGKKVMMK